MAERILSLYATYAFTDAFWAVSEKERHEIRRRIVQEAGAMAEATHFYSLFPARSDADFMIWSSWVAEQPEVPAKAFANYQATTDEWRRFVKPTQTLWGFTKPSMYARGKSEQDMDPMDSARTTYLVVYPFSKTKEWYLMSMDARQGQMNEHIKIGKQYFDIKQLLLYSFGLQDQEFVVSYEVSELPRFSDLVYVLRSTEARRHTALDTPLITAIYQTPEEFAR